jgi:predicted nuclease of predicted toxin-antitoxin system
MKLLFDQNLSPSLVRRLVDLIPDSLHVREVGMKDADDSIVWDYAKQNDFMIVSKDSDFHQRSFVHGQPPKVIWVKLGNCPTTEVEKLLRANYATIISFKDDHDATFLSLS